VTRAGAGQLAFAALFIVLGIQGLVTGKFTAVWSPVSENTPAREGLAYLCAIVSLASGAGLLWKRTARFAAGTLFAYLLLWCLVFRLPVVLSEPRGLLPWYGLAEPAVMMAAAWTLYAFFSTNSDRHRLAFVTGKRGVRIARVVYGLCMIPFGLGHFVYFQRTVSMVPRYFPAPQAWASFTGVAFLAAGAGILFGVFSRLAATLSAWQIGLFTLLVWIPMVAAGSLDADLWTEFITSIALTAGAWVVADSYRDTPWLAIGKF